MIQNDARRCKMMMMMDNDDDGDDGDDDDDDDDDDDNDEDITGLSRVPELCTTIHGHSPTWC